MKEKQIIRLIGMRERDLETLQLNLERKRQPKPKLSREERKANIIVKTNEVRLRQREKIKELKRRLDLAKKLNLSYRHFRAPYETIGPILSIGWKVKESIIAYSIAICSKNDYFDRTEARHYINERFDDGFVAEFSINTPNEGIELKGSDELIIGHFLAHKFDKTIFDMEIPSNAKFV